jgi:hypothetical protein
MRTCVLFCRCALRFGCGAASAQRLVYNTPVVNNQNITSANDILLQNIRAAEQSRNGAATAFCSSPGFGCNLQFHLPLHCRVLARVTETLLVVREQTSWIGGGQFQDHFVAYITLDIPPQQIR